MQKKKFLRFLILLLLVTLNYQCISYGATKSKLNVGVYNFKPIVFINEAGKAQGLFVDILNHIAEKKNWEITYIPGSWKECISRLESGKIDLLTNVAYTADRNKIMDFTDNYLLLDWGVVYKKKEAPINTIFDLQGKTIGVLNADPASITFKLLLDQFGIRSRYLKKDNYTQIIKAIDKKEVDAGIFLNTVAIQLAGNYDVEQTAIVFSPAKFKFAVKKNQNRDFLSALDKSIHELKKDKNSIYYRSLHKWINTSGYEEIVPQWLIIVLLVLISISFSLVIFSLLLKKQVGSKTLALVEVNKNLKKEIDERKQFEEELFKKENQYTAIAENSGHYIMRYDREHRLIWANQGAIKAAGLPPDQFLGKTYREMGFPEHLCELWAKNIDAVFITGEVQRVEFDVKLEKRLMTLDLQFSPEFDVGGKVISVIGVSRDITERKQAEVDLRKSEAKYKRLSENSPAVVYQFMMTSAGEFSFPYISDAVESIIGVTAQKVLQDPSELFGMIHPEDQKIFFDGVLNSAKSLELYHAVIRYRRDGHDRWVEARSTPELQEDGSVFWDGFMIDITDHKKNEEKLSLQSEIITRMSEGVAFSDENGIIIYTNPGFERMFGYDPDEMIGKHISIINSPTENKPEDTAKEISDILNNKGSWSGEILNIKKDGSSFWSSANITAMEHFKYGKAFVSVQTDISELKQAKNEKQKLEIKLLQSQKMESIGNLAGGIAHDFNNLLYPIIGFAEMLKEDFPPDSPEYKSAQEIFNAGKRGGELVKQILAFSRQTDHKLRPVRVQSILKEVLKLTRSSIPTDIEIHHDIEQDCGSVMAEPTQIHQIGMNLITNAYHAVEKAGGKISVQLKETIVSADQLIDSPLKSGKYAVLSVSDNGIGISRNMINNIFEPYFTTKDHGKGTGLGLAVVYGIVKEHKGEINVSSKEGKGTTFNVYLPLINKPTMEASVNDQASDLQTGTETLLLVDDENSVVRLEKQMLERLGYSVTDQSSSTEALEVFKANPENFDLVITDMTMPNMTGDKLAKEILSIRSDIPVIICTGFSERINEARAEAIGVKGFLMKPVVKSEMAQMVRKVLDEATIYKKN